MVDAAARTALITGASRGIGRAVAAQWAAAGGKVIACARDPAARHALQPRQGEQPGRIWAQALDVTDAAAVSELAARLENETVDVLVNAAGIFPDQGLDFFAVDEAAIRRNFEVHLLGAWRLTRAFLPGMLARGYGRIVNLTSGYGATGMGAGMTGYRIAKAGVNALTQIAAAEARGDVKINALDPGWVRTDMGGPSAPRSPEEAAGDVVYAATLPADGPNGVLLRRRQPAPW